MWDRIEAYIEERPLLGAILLALWIVGVVGGLHLAMSIPPETYTELWR